jgi:hypothetical protein
MRVPFLKKTLDPSLRWDDDIQKLVVKITVIPAHAGIQRL